MTLKQPVKGIFLDIGWTMDAPAMGHWMLPPKAKELIPGDLLETFMKDSFQEAITEGMAFLDANHQVPDEKAEYEQYLEFYRMLARNAPQLGLTSENVEALAWDKVYNDANYLFYDDVVDVVTRLKQSFKMGIISDTWPSSHRVLKNAGVYHLFDTLTFSCDLGVFKPDSRMYEHALELMGLPPEQTIFVDDIPGNLDAAKKHGIQPVLIVREGEKPEDSPYVTVSSLKELADLLL